MRQAVQKPGMVTSLSPDRSRTNWNQLAWLVASTICCTSGMGRIMEDRLHVAREQRDPLIVVEVRPRGSGGRGCRKPHEAQQHKYTGNCVSRERAHLSPP